MQATSDVDAVPDTGPEEIVEEARLGSTERGVAANGVILALSRAARSFLLYDPSNEAIRHFLQALRVTTEGFLGRFGQLTLEVRPFELVTDGEVVYHERDRERSIAFRLFRDGVRKLTIDPDLTWHELLKLLEVLSIRYTGIRQTEDDMVVLLWKAGFQHIRIEAVEGFVPDDAGDEGDGLSGEPVAGRVHVEPPPDFDLPIAHPDGMAVIRWEEVPPEAVAALVAEDASSMLPELSVRLAEELIAAASDRTDPTTFGDVVHQLREIRDFLLSEGLLGLFLRLVRVLAEARLHDDAAERERDAMLASFADQHAVGRLLHGVSRDAQEAPPEMIELLESIPGNHLETLLTMLAVERGEASRRVTRSLIQHFVPQHGDWIVGTIARAEPAIAVELLRTLARSDRPRTMRAVEELMARPETEVLLEVVRALEEEPTSASVAHHLLRLSAAANEDVRIRAIEQIGRRGVRQAYPPLLARAKRDAPLRLGPREAEALGGALARCDVAQSMQAFREWIKPRGFFSTVLPGHTMLQWVAVSGLVYVPGDEAETLVKYVSERAGTDLQRHCVASMVKRRRLARGVTA